MYYGWRAKIGLIIPAPGAAPEREFNNYAPEGVSILTQRILFEKVDHNGLAALGDRVVEAAKLVSTGKPDLLVFGCTTGSLIKGVGYDQELSRRMEDATGIRAVTTSTAVLAALQALGAKRVVVSTPYSDEVNEAEKKFLENNGFEVLCIKGLGYTDPIRMPRTTFDQMYHLTGEVLDSRADVIFVSCTGLGIVDGVSMLERDFQLPVITSNQTSLWYALRSLSIQDPLPLGRLFTL